MPRRATSALRLGEPLEQPEAVGRLLEQLDPRLERADLVVAGRHVRELSCDENPWAGSANKAVLARTGRIRPDEFPSCRVEAHIAPDGRLVVTGFPPEDLLGA